MNRKWTNIIRFLMDECVPPIIRDNKWFMYPFYYWAYRGKHVTTLMDFKQKYFEWDPAQLQQFYEKIHSISSDRQTDVSANGIRIIMDHCSEQVESVLDVGCGKGHLLGLIKQAYPGIELHGADFVTRKLPENISFVMAEATCLPFADKAFDLVLCTHTIEHIYKARELVKELKRVARKKIIIITPKQRYFYYTLDEHILFFPQKELLTNLVEMEKYDCSNIEGDWVYIGYMPVKS
ncbi:class I SAM-dependent methyltransferase [Pseudoflavitalea sp. X16]|uniref:class I SAM-dependent methyltransferase n=1 Tax=Paraflavitalea devenefica TaxID=2716334 RepID=UPI00141F9945|nr:class I SAM-dependent methyltransferase [Paraflavitalea devenefica]NII27520.1 class I SAM-dependent methyltransferase [Paraflavitalea devenefica]